MTANRILRLVAPAVGVLGLLTLLVSLPGSSNEVARATSCVSSSEASLDSIESQFLNLVNDHRQSKGLAPFKNSPGLNAASAMFALDMAENGYASNHIDSQGRSLSQRLSDCGYTGWTAAGENIMHGSGPSDPVVDAQAALDAWLNSSGHRANIENGNFTMIGIARVHKPGSPNEDYWVTDFGNYDDSGSSGPTPTSTPIVFNTPTPTNTPVPTSTPTNTPTPQPTATPAADPTATPTSEPTATATTEPSATPTGGDGSGDDAEGTPTPTATGTPGAEETGTPDNEGSGPLPVTLASGANLISWPGEPMPIAEAIDGMEGEVVVVYGWNPETRRWTRYIPNEEWAWVNSLHTFEPGGVYWVMRR